MKEGRAIYSQQFKLTVVVWNGWQEGGWREKRAASPVKRGGGGGGGKVEEGKGDSMGGVSD